MEWIPYLLAEPPEYRRGLSRNEAGLTSNPMFRHGKLFADHHTGVSGGILCLPEKSSPAGEKRKMYVKIDLKPRRGCCGIGAVCPGPARRRRGLTLIEVIVSMALLLMVVLGLFGAFSYGFTTIKISQEDVRASQILLQKLETLRLYDWSLITNGYCGTNFGVNYSTNGGVAYAGTIAVTPVPAAESYSNSLRQVTVSLSWVSTGVPRYRVVTTLVSQNGIQTYKP
jgi:prepilin-type N-terminal cleavage/methylation domain-containing protein